LGKNQLLDWKCSALFNPDYKVIFDAGSDALLTYERNSQFLRLSRPIPDEKVLSVYKMLNLTVCDAVDGTVDGSAVNYCENITLIPSKKKFKLNLPKVRLTMGLYGVASLKFSSLMSINSLKKYTEQAPTHKIVVKNKVAPAISLLVLSELN